MTVVLLLTRAHGLGTAGVAPRRARVRDRLAARLLAHHLDRQLAEGVAPDRCVALSLRARRRIAPAIAAALARELRRVVREAEGRCASRARVPARRAAVLAAAAELDALARRLVAPAPRDARGVAQVRLLLGDGCGPLYSARAVEDLRAAVARARAALEPI